MNIESVLKQFEQAKRKGKEPRQLYIGKHGRPEYDGECGGRYRRLCEKRSAVRLCKRCELTTSRKRAAKDMAAREEENAARLALLARGAEEAHR